VILVPSLMAVRKTWPDARITLVADSWVLSLADLAPFADVKADACKAPWASLWDPSLTGLTKDLPQTDLLIDTTNNPYAFEVADRVLDCEYFGLPRLPTRSGLLPLSKRCYLQFVAALALPHPYEEPALWPWPDLVDADPWDFHADTYWHPVVAIHPGAGTPAKCWPLSAWLDVAARLRARAGAKIVWVLGRAESALGRDAHWHNGDVVLFPPSPATISLIAAYADCYCGHDTGPSHVAAWTQRPDGARPRCVFVWQQKSIAAWAPRLMTSTVLSMEGYTDTPCSPQYVADAVIEQIAAGQGGK
jgi:ADP-heptose:LPS heptosyltransferase